MNHAGEIVGVLLAAGKGLRFGADKLLHPLADGTPMAVAAARNLHVACERCIAVLRPEQFQLAGLLNVEGLSVVYSVEAEFGMGHSLAAGVRASPDATGWIIALADMPFIKSQTIRQVADALAGDEDIVAPSFGDRRGHPVVFGRAYGDELAGLCGDRGARDVIALHSQRLITLACDDPGVLRDIDRRLDLHAGMH